MQAKTAPIFEYVLVIKLDQEPGAKAVTDYRFPPKDSTSAAGDKIASAITRFCFPEAEAPDPKGKIRKKLLSKLSSHSETFSFVLTEADGSRQFGYCRRMKAPDPKRKTGYVLECFCILSLHSQFSLFRQILDIVEDRRRASNTGAFTFLKSVLTHEFPQPGERIVVNTFSLRKGVDREEYPLVRSLRTEFDYLDYVSFATLFRLVPVNKIIDLVSHLLLERRCIIAAKHLGTLSTCINAIGALLYPFSWQHVFIPVLPQSLLDYCSAPMPFLLGILDSSLPLLKKLPMEEVVVLNVDRGSFIMDPGFPNMLPPELSKQLDSDLRTLVSTSKGRAFDLGVGRAFVKFFRGIFGSYKNYFRQHKFDLEAFINAQPAEHKEFLMALEGSQMWQSFLAERETAERRGKLMEECILLQQETTELSKLNSCNFEQPAVFQICTNCGADVEDGTEDKHGNPMCGQCMEVKNKRGVGGWLKMMRGAPEEEKEPKGSNPLRRMFKKADTDTTNNIALPSSSSSSSSRIPRVTPLENANSSAPAPQQRKPSSWLKRSSSEEFTRQSPTSDATSSPSSCSSSQKATNDAPTKRPLALNRSAERTVTGPPNRVTNDVPLAAKPLPPLPRFINNDNNAPSYRASLATNAFIMADKGGAQTNSIPSAPAPSLSSSLLRSSSSSSSSSSPSSSSSLKATATSSPSPISLMNRPSPSATVSGAPPARPPRSQDAARGIAISLSRPSSAPSSTSPSSPLTASTPVPNLSSASSSARFVSSRPPVASRLQRQQQPRSSSHRDTFTKPKTPAATTTPTQAPSSSSTRVNPLTLFIPGSLSSLIIISSLL
ncbi:DENN MADD domain containing 1A [Balamuthia mandrillaris]